METLNLTQIINIAIKLHDHRIHRRSLHDFIENLHQSDPVVRKLASNVEQLDEIINSFEVQVSTELHSKTKRILDQSAELNSLLTPEHFSPAA